jgi:hypothetical protein
VDRIIAYCGLDCTDCQAYTATQSGDPGMVEQVAAQWRLEFNAPEITAESIVCDGCLGTNGARLGGYCRICELRACGVERGVANCAYCHEYACEKLESWFANAPQARATLDEIRSRLSHG